MESWVFFESFNLPSRKEFEKHKVFIFFGDFFASYIYFQENNISNRVIYVLSEKSKSILKSMEPRLKNEIKVIPRYELFPLESQRRKLPRLMSESYDLVYSGRISRSKNIKLLLILLKELQVINPRVGLKIFGEFDHFQDVQTKTSPFSYSYEKELRHFIEHSTWSRRPQLIHGLDSEDWRERLESKDILINLSTYWMEDFSVSVAQAQQDGIPIIVSDIGGLSDVVGDNVITIPTHLIEQDFITEDETILRCHALSILNFFKSKEDTRGINDHQSTETFQQLPAFSEIVSNAAFDYVRTPEGRLCLQDYRKIWGQDRWGHKKEKILLLVSNEQNHWNSLIKITEQIKKFWLQFQSQHCELVCLNVDFALDKGLLFKSLKDVKVIVAPALAENTINILKLIRKTFKVNAPIISYPHELPSIFFASLQLRKLDDLFSQQDVFIVHNEADIALTKKSFKQVNVIKIPAGFIDDEAVVKNDCSYRVKNLFYVGRISEQKNLHTLLWSLSLIKDELIENGVKLQVYGHHDHFGSPNFGISGEDYLDFLGRMIEQLDLSQLVIFHGFKPISSWGKLIRDKHGAGIFPSIHSDENFGYAPFEMLSAHIPVILSDWGGYREFAKGFSNLVHKVSVYQSEAGPCINPLELAKKIKNLILVEGHEVEKIDTQLWSRQHWIEQLQAYLKNSMVADKPLELSSIGMNALQKCTYSPYTSLKARGWLLNGIIYKNYCDPLFLESARIYGAKKMKDVLSTQDIFCAPWVNKVDKKFIVCDPLKGEFSLSSRRKLIKLGFAFPKKT